MYYISVFLAAQMPVLLGPTLGLAGMFLVFAFISGLCVVVILLLVPETEGKTYTEYVKTKGGKTVNIMSN